ncbi:glucosylglycerol 3-phosphatase [Coleofasciculus sp. G2-EDA-02]|uniref:glucosylglycerol 3-phosphatase n=1 Tax=Coleofasciculus sp. G2-EDA-02 TaxID=3069529 RepID=UPI0032FCE204
MSVSPQLLPHEHTLSLKTEVLADVLTHVENILIIQDLDGVCMGLVKDPLRRVIDRNYVKATQAFDGHFYVLTNGEHIGEKGVNGIIERAFGNPAEVKAKGLYLPGLAGGGVQWQDRQGNVSHPGVSEAELEFLAEVPQRIKIRLCRFFEQKSIATEIDNLDECIQASVLENKVSPSANLNTFYEKLRQYSEIYMDLQKDMQNLMQEVLKEAQVKGLGDSFFVHYAPNLGRDLQGQEILRPAQRQDSGTTDFQFMLQGAIKEAGVLAILNRYYFQRTGSYPLGEEFNVRQAPKTLEELLELVKGNFDPKEMPLMIGVGDTVNSSVEDAQGKLTVRRGGSDRNFLQLIQRIGQELDTGNIIVYIDSSQGEVKNRKSVKIGQHETSGEDIIVLEGPGDVRDVDEPLTLNFIFHKGHQQYNEFFQQVARERKASDHR